jgi:hypothetical protein
MTTTPKHGRLFRLLYSPSPATRSEAAAAISIELASSSSEVHVHLLNQVHQHLCSGTWEARIAASQVLQHYTLATLPTTSEHLDLELALAAPRVLLATDIPERLPTLNNVFSGTLVWTAPTAAQQPHDQPASTTAPPPPQRSVRQQVQQAIKDQRLARRSRASMVTFSAASSLFPALLNDLLDGDWMVRHGGALRLLLSVDWPC